jgi:hypothetical protein
MSPILEISVTLSKYRNLCLQVLHIPLEQARGFQETTVNLPISCILSRASSISHTKLKFAHSLREGLRLQNSRIEKVKPSIEGRLYAYPTPHKELYFNLLKNNLLLN